MAEPFRITITNLSTDSLEFIQPQFNPDQVTEKLSAGYARLKVLGQPHEVLQYEGTENYGLEFDLSFDALSTRGAGRFDTSGAFGIEDARRFLHGAMYPSDNARDVATGGPPELLFDWPEMWLLVTRMPSIKFVHRRFATSGMSTLFTATVTLDESRTVRLTRESVLARGTRRA